MRPHRTAPQSQRIINHQFKQKADASALKHCPPKAIQEKFINCEPTPAARTPAGPGGQRAGQLIKRQHSAGAPAGHQPASLVFSYLTTLFR